VCGKIKEFFPTIKTPQISYFDKDEEPVRISNDPEFNYSVRWATHRNDGMIVLNISEKPSYVEPLKSFLNVACNMFGFDKDEEDIHDLCEELPERVDFITTKLQKAYSQRHEVLSLAEDILSEGMKEFEQRVNPVVPEEEIEISRPIPQMQHNAACDHCSAMIKGVRYKCMNCPDYDLCSQCESENMYNSFHDETHVFVKLVKPSQSLPQKEEPLPEPELEPEPEPEEEPHDEQTESHLFHLEKLGFPDRARNIALLTENGGDFHAVLDRLLL